MFTKTQSNSERLAAWRKFRQEFPANGTADDVINAFSTIKIDRRILDYYTPENWPDSTLSYNDVIGIQRKLGIVGARGRKVRPFVSKEERAQCQTR